MPFVAPVINTVWVRKALMGDVYIMYPIRRIGYGSDATSRCLWLESRDSGGYSMYTVPKSSPESAPRALDLARSVLTARLSENGILRAAVDVFAQHGFSATRV